MLPLFWDMVDSFRASGFGYRALAKLCLFYSALGIRGTPVGRCQTLSAKALNTGDTEEHRVDLISAIFPQLGEHFFGVDGYEGSAAAGQDFVFFV